MNAHALNDSRHCVSRAAGNPRWSMLQTSKKTYKFIVLTPFSYRCYVPHAQKINENISEFKTQKNRGKLFINSFDCLLS